MGEDEHQRDDANEDGAEDLQLDDREADDVRGGITVRKSGKEQQEYLQPLPPQ